MKGVHAPCMTIYMARISEISLRQKQARYTASVRKTINFFEEYVPFMEEALEQIEKQLESCGFIAGSPPFTCFYNTELEKLDVEVGYHLADMIPEKGGLDVYLLPSLRVLSAIDRGPYKKQDTTLMDLFNFIKTNHYEMQGPIYYYYLNKPDRPESEYLTQMVIPIK